MVSAPAFVFAVVMALISSPVLQLTDIGAFPVAAAGTVAAARTPATVAPATSTAAPRRDFVRFFLLVLAGTRVPLAGCGSRLVGLRRIRHRPFGRCAPGSAGVGVAGDNHRHCTRPRGVHPVAARVSFYQYHFTTTEERHATGAFWTRELVGTPRGIRCPISR